MKKRLQEWVRPSITLFLMSFMAIGSAQGAKPESIDIVTTIKPLHSIVSFITDGVTEPHLLVKARASPHDYALKPSDTLKLQEAELIFYIGPHFETFFPRALQYAKAPASRQIVMAVTPKLHLHPVREEYIWENDEKHAHHHSHSGRHDPHLWLDPHNAKVMAIYIADLLSEYYPRHKETFESNLTVFLERLQEVDQAIAAKLAPVKDKPFIVFHDGYQYFEKYYGLRSVGAVALNPHRNPGAKTIRNIQKLITDSKAVCLFTEPQFPSGFVETLVRDTGIRAGELDGEWGVTIDQYHHTPAKEAYFYLLHNLSNNVVKCLSDKKT